MQKFNFTPFPNLTTNRLILRQLSENDSKEIFSLRTDKSVNKYLDRQIQQNSNEVIEILEQHNTKLVLQGHLHFLEDIQYNGIHYITGGGLLREIKWLANGYKIVSC